MDTTVEVKRTLDGNVVEYPCKSVLFEPDARAVILCEIAEAEPVVGGRLTLEPGTRSCGFFWLDRPYVPYHWLVEGRTMLHYVNLGRVVTLEETRVVWDDYAVDVLVWPDGRVEVVDEDEIPPATDESILTFIADAKARLTVTTNLFVAVFALESAAEQLTTVRPRLKALPERGRHKTETGPSTASRAVTE